MAQFLRKTVHVYFDGQSVEVSLAALNIRSSATDTQLKAAVSDHFDLPAHYLDDYIVIRGSQAIIVDLDNYALASPC